ncbi:MAG TPA: murein biosynthesis integral membrane protein MurJ [bacterium]|nr:murein biosynthesis integral membrane protein MurJ [bacterium]
MRYVLTGGGTGGHVYPNLAIAGELARHDSEAQFLYLGVAGRAEADIVPRHGIPIRFVPARGMPTRKASAAMIVFLAALAWGTLKALAILLRYRPRLVVATGGYASAPALLAARLLRRPILVHEQNAYPGLVNRTFGKMAGRVCVSFPESLVHFQHNGKLVGYPVRPEIFALRAGIDAEEKARRKQELGIDPARQVVLITGGSLGARSINRAVADLLPLIAADETLRRRVYLVHAVGRFATKEYHAVEDTLARLHKRGIAEEAITDFYRRETYLYEIENWLRVADVVIGRAGAGTLTEIAATGLPAVVIPKSGLPGDHQVKNAEALREAGACLVLREERARDNGEAYDSIAPERLLSALRELLDLPDERRAAMREAALGFVHGDALGAIRAEAMSLLAGPPKKTVMIRRRRTFLVDQNGARHEVLFDRSRIGSGSWDDVRLTNEGLERKHFWLKRSGRIVENRVVETWTVIPRRPLLMQRAGETQARELSGPTELADGDRLELPDGAVLSLDFDWIEVPQVKAEKGAVENIFSQGAGTLIAKLIGFVREAFLSRFFGAGLVMDIFAVALSLANLMREVVAEMALENAFLPSFRLFYGRNEDKKDAWRLAWQVFNIFFLISSAITALAIVTCPWWIHLIAPGFVEKGVIDQTTAMTRLMFPFLILMSISAFLGTLLQSFDRFGPNAFAPVLYSIGLVFAVVVFNPLFGMYSLGLGVLIGGVLQILFQMFFLLRRGLREKIAWNAYRPRIKAEPGTKKVVALSGPVFLDATLNKISGIVDKVLATPLIAGSVSALYFSRLLVVLPFSVLAMSISRVFLRDLSDVAARGDARQFRDLLARGINATIFLILPATAAMIALSTPLVRFIYEGGKFTAENTTMTSMALVCYTLGLIGWSLTSLYSRVFSSQLDTRTSLITNAGSLVVYLVFALTLVHTPLAHAGLALATSLSFIFNMFWRHWIAVRRLHNDGAPLGWAPFGPTFAKTTLASVVTVLVIVLLYVDPGPGRGLWVNMWAFTVPATAGLGAFLLFAFMMRTQPLLDLLNHLSARLGFGRPFGSGPVRYQNGTGNVRTLTAAGLLAEAEHREFSAEERAIVLDRLEGFLRHDDWWIRNLGIKLSGVMKLTEKIDLLGDAIAGTTEKKRLWRWLLGSRREVGFIRRNAVAALVNIGAWDERVKKALLAGLEDPYYEVRQYALRGLIPFAEQARGDAEVVAAIGRRLADTHFEVVPVAAKALAELAVDPSAFAQLKPLLADPRWPVRGAAADGLRRLYDRQVFTDADALRDALSAMLLTSEMIEPVFPLKRVVKKAMQGLPEKEK